MRKFLKHAHRRQRLQKTRLRVLCSLCWGGMAGYGNQDNRQDFYESGYDMDGVQQEQQAPPQADQQGGVQQIPAQDQQAQWGNQQQAYYPPTAGYVQQQGYGQQGGRRSVHCSPYKRTILSFLFRAQLYCVYMYTLVLIRQVVVR